MARQALEVAVPMNRHEVDYVSAHMPVSSHSLTHSFTNRQAEHNEPVQPSHASINALIHLFPSWVLATPGAPSFKP